MKDGARGRGRLETGDPLGGLAPAQQRRNVVALGADMTLFMMALGLLAPTTLVPLFVSKLTDSPLAIGALSAAFQLGWLPALFVAGYIERSARKLPWLLIFSALERLPALGLALLALAAPSLGLPLLLGLVYLCRFAQAVCGGLVTAPWLDLVARAVPASRRGRFMGGFTMAGNLLGAGVAALAAPLLEWLPFPLGFAVCFGLGFVILALGFLPLLWVAEPPGPPPRPAMPFRQQMAELPALLAADGPFRRFLGGMGLQALGTMGASFLVVYAVSRLGASDELAAWYTVALLVAQVGANFVFGWLADRWHWTLVGRLSAGGGLGLAVAALLAPDARWLLVSFVLLGASQAGTMLARMTGPIDFAPPDRRPTYTALSSALLGLVAAAAPLAAGQTVALLGYEWLFGICAAFSLAATLTLGRGAEVPKSTSPDAPA